MPAPLTPSLLEQLHHISGEYTASRIGPRGRVYREGRALQWLLPSVPVTALNRAFALDPDDEGQLDRVLARFAEAGLSPRIEVLPHILTPLFSRRLSERGLVVRETRVLFYAEAHEIEAPDTRAHIERVDAETFVRFHRVDVEAQGNPESGPASSFSWWLEQEGWQLFLATLDGEDAGVGISYLRGDIGYLASAATLEAYRGRGVQQALIRARCQAARSAGARWLTARAEFGTTSQRNLQRAGFHLAAVSLLFG